MVPLSVTTPLTRPSRRSKPITGSFSLISTPMSSTLALRAGTYRCGSENPDLRSSTPASVSSAIRSGNRLGDLAAVQHLELASEPPPHVPERRRLRRTRLRGEVQASDLMEAVPIQDPAETLEQVEADRPCAHLGLRAHQHRDYAAGLEAGAATHGALVYNYTEARKSPRPIRRAGGSWGIVSAARLLAPGLGNPRRRWSDRRSR